MSEEIHECEFYRGKISDVTIRNKNIHCRRCGKMLEHSKVDPKTLKELKSNGKI